MALKKPLGLEVKLNVLVDSECKNINPEVNDLVDSELISRTIAQIDIEQSNSMIEMFFHRIKHWHLFTILLSDLESFAKGADFYLTKTTLVFPIPL